MKKAIEAVLKMIVGVLFAQVEAISEGTIVTFGNEYSQVWSAVVQIANRIIEPIAVFIVVIMFLLSLMEKLSNEQFTLEHVLRDVIKLCLGLYLVGNSVEIVVGCINLGNGILSRVNGLGLFSSGSLTITDELFVTTIMATLTNPFSLLLLAVVVIILMLVLLLIMFLMRAVCMMRTLEIAIRTAISPLALSDTFAGNLLNSHAIGFIRSFAGVCLQGVFITIIANFIPIYASGIFTNATGFNDVFGGLMKLFAVSIACLILMFKSGTIAKEMLGGR